MHRKLLTLTLKTEHVVSISAHQTAAMTDRRRTCNRILLLT